MLRTLCLRQSGASRKEKTGTPGSSLCAMSEVWIWEGGWSGAWAVAYRRCSTDDVDEEAEARRERPGLWEGKFEVPWEWRTPQ